MRNNQNRRDFLKTMGLAAVALASPRLSGQQLADKASGQKPNIIFLMTDDMGIGDTTVYNPQSKIPTPNMEKLAKQGVIFTDAHSPSAVCTPTRYGIITGRYCWRSRLTRGALGGYNPPLIEKNRLTIGGFLKQHGYSTACIGKWHLGQDWALKPGKTKNRRGNYGQDSIDFSKPIAEGPLRRGFDYFFGTAGCPTDDAPFCFIENDRTVGIPNVISPTDPANEGRRLLMTPGWRHEDVDTTFTGKAIGFIEKHVEAKGDEPFFLYLVPSVPHIPWFPPDFVKGKSQAGPRGDQVYLADWMLGQIMDTLDKLKISEDTLLIFTSDNGPREGVNGHKSSWNYRGQKGQIWEGGHRIPFIARWPGKITPGTTCDEVTTLTDLMATCAEIVGAELPNDAGPDSYSMLPALLGKKLDKPIREATVHHSGAGVFAIRQGKWKLILGTKTGGYLEGGPKEGTPGQLYNLENDPAEQNDLWDEKPGVVERLNKLLEKYKRQGHSRSLKSP